MKRLKENLEAILFAVGYPISMKELSAYLPEASPSQIEDAILELKSKYTGISGIHLITFADKVQFCTNPVYGELISEILRPIRERNLTEVLMEVLAIVAYKGPVTRSEIANIRQKNSDYSVATLLKLDMIEKVGKKAVAGHPSLYGVTETFLKKFNLQTKDDLPDYNEVLKQIKEVEESHSSDNLFEDSSFSEDVIDIFGVESESSSLEELGLEQRDIKGFEEDKEIEDSTNEKYEEERLAEMTALLFENDDASDA